MSDQSLSSNPRIAALKVQVEAIETAGRIKTRATLPFDIEAVDRKLTGGGLAAALHEACSATPSPNDEASAILFLAALAARFSNRDGKPVLWALTRRDLFAPALAQAGLGPDRLLYAECRNDEEALAVMEEGIRHGSLAAVIGEVTRASMAATRRLQLASEEGGTAAFLRRRWRKNDLDPMLAPSAAFTRWRLACAPSSPVAFRAIGSFEGIGRACWSVELVRQRGGPSCTWLMEAPDAEARFALPARSGDRPDLAVGAQIQAGQRTRAA